MSNKIVDVEALKEFRKRNDVRYQKQYPKEFVKVIRTSPANSEVSDKHWITFDAPVTLLAGSFAGKKSKNKYYKASELSKNKKGNHILVDSRNNNLLQLPAGTYSYAQILKFVLDKLWFLSLAEELDLTYDMDVVEQKLSNQDINFQNLNTYYGGVNNKLFMVFNNNPTADTVKTFYLPNNYGDEIIISNTNFYDNFHSKYVDNTALAKFGISLRLRFVKNFELKENDAARSKGWTGQMSNYQMKIMVNFKRDTVDGSTIIYLTDFYATVQITN